MASTELEFGPRAEQEQDPQTCPVQMSGGRPCGRPLYAAGGDQGSDHVCLMHCANPLKDPKAFQREFEKILEAAGEGIADFTGFVFPVLKFEGREFNAECLFHRSVFLHGAEFYHCLFKRLADFGFVEFKVVANFIDARFMEGADFYLATFEGTGYFSRCEFVGVARFESATFEDYSYFDKAQFRKGAIFEHARLSQGGDFQESSFNEDANFLSATFGGHTTFAFATFEKTACFNGSLFERSASCVAARFAACVYFVAAEFRGSVDFTTATFADRVNFCQTRFDAEVKFWETQFREDASLGSGPEFRLVKFQKPELVVFCENYLGQAIFRNCDVSRITFYNVRWGRRSSNGKCMLFDEAVLRRGAVVPTSRGSTLRLNPEGGDYRLVGELYQQLKKNYDERRDYWTAGDFHYGEMEMKRLAVPEAGRLWTKLIGLGLSKARASSLRTWWRQQLGHVAWYKYGSEYGESYLRPFLLLSAIVLLFGLLYPCVGLKYQRTSVTPAAGPSAKAEISDEVVLTYIHPLPPGSRSRPWRARLGLLRDSLLTSVDIASFQREPLQEPAHRTGHVLRLAELVLTSTMIALFLLAVRRQFRR